MTEKEFEDLYYQSCEEVPEHSSIGIFKEKVFSLKLFAQNVEAYAKAQRTWVGLTDEEFEKMLNDVGFTRTDLLMIGSCVEQIVDLVEAKLKEKNT